jgi:hypothetical protein
MTRVSSKSNRGLPAASRAEAAPTAKNQTGDLILIFLFSLEKNLLSKKSKFELH